MAHSAPTSAPAPPVLRTRTSACQKEPRLSLARLSLFHSRCCCSFPISVPTLSSRHAPAPAPALACKAPLLAHLTGACVLRPSCIRPPQFSSSCSLGRLACGPPSRLPVRLILRASIQTNIERRNARFVRVLAPTRIAQKTHGWRQDIAIAQEVTDTSSLVLPQTSSPTTPIRLSSTPRLPLPLPGSGAAIMVHQIVQLCCCA